MNPVGVKKMFDRVTKDLGHLFEDSALSIIPESVGQMFNEYSTYKQGKQDNWGYKIFPERPLRFKKSERPRQNNYVDIYCDVRWGTDDLPKYQDIKVRVWDFHGSTVFREEFDAVAIRTALDNSEREADKGRVVSRFHFDRVNRDGSSGVSSEYHPTFHLQVGGKSLKDELCWHPETFDIPRIPHHPMDFFLICQLVAANFFPENYRVIKEQAEWRNQVSVTQKALLSGYYQKCLQCINEGHSLIDVLTEL